MVPIQDLLHRIRWDPEFGRGEFVIGYYDRIEHEIILVPFREIRFPKDGPGIFELIDQEARKVYSPLGNTPNPAAAVFWRETVLQRYTTSTNKLAVRDL